MAIAGFAGCGDDDNAAAAAIPGNPWTLTGGNDVAGGEQVAPSITFNHGQASGSTGCNHFTAPYTVKGDKLDLGQVAATQMACSGAAADVERAFLVALRNVNTWRLDGSELVLLGDDDKELLR